MIYDAINFELFTERLKNDGSLKVIKPGKVCPYMFDLEQKAGVTADNNSKRSSEDLRPPALLTDFTKSECFPNK